MYVGTRPWILVNGLPFRGIVAISVNMSCMKLQVAIRHNRPMWSFMVPFFFFSGRLGTATGRNSDYIPDDG